MSTDNTASFHPRPVQLVDALFEEIRLVAQVTPYNESPVTAIFDLEGYSSVGAQLQKRCLARRVDKEGLTTRNGKEIPRAFTQGKGVQEAVPTGGSWVLPKLVKSPELQYPMRASSRGIEGSVDLVFDVDLKGSVVGVEVVDAKPPGVFDRAAINYIRGRQYDPATRNGKPTTFRQIEESVLFTLPQ
jgi:TonB family protein